MATKPMSLRAYAKHRGETLGAVQKALKTGRITALKSGKIDPAAADKAWSQGTDPSKQRKAPGAGATPRRTSPWPAPRARPTTPSSPSSTSASGPNSSSTRGPSGLGLSRTRAPFATPILGLSNKIGAELAAETDPVKVQNLLILELTRVLEELATAASLPEKPPEAQGSVSETREPNEFERRADQEFDRGFWAGIRPDPILTVSEWADQHRILPKIAAEPGRWRTSRTPYLQEIMDCLSSMSEVQEVVFMKSAQIGGTEAGNNWIAYVIDHSRAR
jgi:hypothetical protein